MVDEAINESVVNTLYQFPLGLNALVAALGIVHFRRRESLEGSQEVRETKVWYQPAIDAFFGDRTRDFSPILLTM